MEGCGTGFAGGATEGADEVFAAEFASFAFWKNDVILLFCGDLEGDALNLVWKIELVFFGVVGAWVEFCFVSFSACIAARLANASCLFLSI